MWTYFTYFSCLFSQSFWQLFKSFHSHKLVTPLFEILRSFGVFILAEFWGPLNKLNKYFLQSVDSSLFFRNWIFYTFFKIFRAVCVCWRVLFDSNPSGNCGGQLLVCHHSFRVSTFITCILKSLVILTIWLALRSVIYLRDAIFFVLNCNFFPGK